MLAEADVDARADAASALVGAELVLLLLRGRCSYTRDAIVVVVVVVVSEARDGETNAVGSKAETGRGLRGRRTGYE